MEALWYVEPAIVLLRRPEQVFVMAIVLDTSYIFRPEYNNEKQFMSWAQYNPEPMNPQQISKLKFQITFTKLKNQNIIRTTQTRVRIYVSKNDCQISSSWGKWCLVIQSLGLGMQVVMTTSIRIFFGMHEQRRIFAGDN